MKKSILTLMGIALIAGLTAFPASAKDDDMDKPDGDKPPRKEMKKHQRKGGGMNQDGPDGRMNKMMQFWASLSDEERARLEKLRQEDPEAFRAEMLKLKEKAREQRQQEEAKLRELVKKYRTAQTDEEKQKALDEIKSEVAKEFNATMAANKKGIEQAEKSLEKYKKAYEENMKKASQTIDEKVKRLIEEKDQPKQQDKQKDRKNDRKIDNQD